MPDNFNVTVNLFEYYRDEAIESLPYIAEEYDENSVIDTIRTFSILESHCWLNLYQGQRPVGFVAGYLVSKPWNNQCIIGHIQFIYIIEEYRNLENFKTLLDSFQEWAVARGAKELMAGDIGINPDRMRKLYEHFGFKSLLTMIKGIEQ
jgi:GNAT superfamily N-acetyltransferase